MGFRTGSYAHVWEVSPMSQTCTRLRISISRKNKTTGEYEQEFSGFILAVGTATAQKALGLTKDSRIKLGNCDVTTKYDKENDRQYTNFKVFDFEDVTQDNSNQPSQVEEPMETFETGDLEEDSPFNSPF